MPVKPSKRAKSSSSPPSRFVAIQQVVDSLTGRPTSRLRRYLAPDQGRDWNSTSPETPEGRLTVYNQEDWYSPSRDDKGHSERIMLDIHPAVMEQLASHANSGKFPIGRSVKTLCRVAIRELLMVLDRLEPLPHSHMNIIDQIHYLNAHAEITRSYQEKFQKGRENVLALMAQGAVNEARKMALDLIKFAKSIPSRELKEKYRWELEHQFKGLLKSGKSVVRTNVVGNKKRRKRRAEDHERTI